jgi:hypothetical protein
MARSEWLQVRVSPVELAEVKRLAGLAGLDVSAFVRARALGEAPRAPVDRSTPRGPDLALAAPASPRGLEALSSVVR